MISQFFANISIVRHFIQGHPSHVIQLVTLDLSQRRCKKKEKEKCQKQAPEVF